MKSDLEPSRSNLKFVEVMLREKIVLVAIIALSCTTNDGTRNAGEEAEVFIPIGESTEQNENWGQRPVAHAENLDTGQPEFIIPEDPVHISLSFPKVAERLRVNSLTGDQFPYQHTVTDEGNELTLTLYVPREVEMGIAIAPEDGDGNVVGNEDLFVLRTHAKLGSSDETLDETPKIISFATGAETQLQLGENTLDREATVEFIAGQHHLVQHGVYEADHDLTCQVSWQGAEKLFLIQAGPSCHEQPFEVTMRKGQKMGLYPIVTDEQLLDGSVDEPVIIHLEETF